MKNNKVPWQGALECGEGAMVSRRDIAMKFGDLERLKR